MKERLVSSLVLVGLDGRELLHVLTRLILEDVALVDVGLHETILVCSLLVLENSLKVVVITLLLSGVAHDDGRNRLLHLFRGIFF